MISLETVRATSTSINPISSPRISFSTDSLDDDDSMISTNPDSVEVKEKEKRKEKTRNMEFEFLSSDKQTMLSADELFFDGKLLPFWQTRQSEKLKKISLKADQKTEEAAKAEDDINQVERKVSWFLDDDDPSPRPPKCTVLWKELLRLRKQRSSTLSPSSSSSSSSSSTSSLKSLDLLPPIGEGKEGSGNKDNHAKRMKKGPERTRSTSIRIRPVVNVLVCTQGRRSAVPPLFSFRKGKLEK